ncbi:proteasome activator pa28 REG alpha beta subunit [Peniophora sp. CONT]|nr:proteasome activator pa28 REG alpha beta subunit [Peniophora sp. CONT]
MSDVHLDKHLESQLDAFRKKVDTDANEVILHSFPAKILELQQLIVESDAESSPFHISHGTSHTDPTIYPSSSASGGSEPENKKRKLEHDGSAVNGFGAESSAPRFTQRMLANQHLQTVHGVVKDQCMEMSLLCDKVKLWVNLTMPKIEDGDNFGVQIQEEVLNELHRSQESAINMRDVARQSHLNRAKICSKIIKYPHVEDYTVALKEHDERQLYLARQNIRDLRNIYAVMTDIIHKNLAKLRAPKGNNSVGLY